MISKVYSIQLEVLKRIFFNGMGGDWDAQKINKQGR